MSYDCASAVMQARGEVCALPLGSSYGLQGSPLQLAGLQLAKHSYADMLQQGSTQQVSTSS